MTIIIFSKCSKFNAISRNGTKKFEKFFCFEHNCLLTGVNKFSQSQTGYLSFAINMLPSNPKISHITKGNILQIRFLQNAEKTWWNCSPADFTRVWAILTRWLWKSVLKRCFSESGLTKSLTVCNLWNKVGMTIIFFSKIFKISCSFRKWNKKTKKKKSENALILKIIGFESGTTNSHTPEQDTRHWQATCYQPSLRFNISLRGIFWKSGSLGVMKYMTKVLSCTFYKSLGPFNMLTVNGVPKRGFLESGLTRSLTVCSFRNKVGTTIIFFSKMFKI